MCMPLVSLVIFALGTAVLPPQQNGTAPADRFEEARPNDNHVPAGRLENGVLTVRLEVRRAVWYPEGPSGPGLDVFAFAEEGKSAQVPGPLLRVPAGTELRVMLRNPLNEGVLTVHGLATRPMADADDIRVGPGEEREVRFVSGAEGAYYYWATIGETADTDARATFLARDRADGQLGGGLIIDPAAGAPADRVLVITHWAATNVDTIVPGGPVLEDRVTDDVWAINGHSWPHTERFSYTVGDSVRWRILNITNDVHPFHLHGFYFRVESRGDGLHDTRAFPAAGHLMVTHLLSVGDTSTFLWVPERPGNWLFHCHFTPHFQPSRTLRPMIDAAGDHRTLAHGEQGMGGLVIGVHVRPGVAVANVAQAGVRRRLRLLARVDAGGTADEPAYGFVLHERGPEPPERAGLLPAPTIVLTRGEPVSIWVVNQLPEPTGVHWHGIELESYYDGVPGFSGEPGRLAPAIAPADSFEVRFTPPRAGTFIYHTHVDEARQQPAGLTGALVVVEAGQPHHSDTDRTYLITTPRSREAAQQSVLLNGKTEADPVQLGAGVTYRMRFVNITFARPGARVILSDDAGPVQWRVSAKDGADLPASRITDEPADRRISIGETFDAEYTPTQSGELRLEVWTNNLRTRLAYAPVKVR